MDALTLLVLAQAQPRAKVRDRIGANHGRILCVSHVALWCTPRKAKYGSWDTPPVSSPEMYMLVDKPGPQGHCAVCGKALRRPRLNSV